MNMITHFDNRFLGYSLFPITKVLIGFNSNRRSEEGLLEKADGKCYDSKV